jgi:hypothetical protein
LKIGYYTSGKNTTVLNVSRMTENLYIDNFVKASPACARAVLETVDALRKAGHDCTEFSFPGGTIQSILSNTQLDITFTASVAAETFVGLTSSDGYKTMLSNLGPDKKV